LTRRGFEHALEIYRDMHQREPAFQLSERDINNWGYQLLAKGGNPRDAIQLFELGIALNSGSANLFDSLGEAYELNKERDLAIRSYRRSLDLDPGNVRAAARLKALVPSHVQDNAN
jgi:tetratricopeptide (TPR) repeat protein